MKITQQIILLCLICMLAFSEAFGAQDPISGFFEVGITRDYFKYEEFNEQGIFLDGEYGYVDGMKFTLGARNNRFETQLVFEKSNDAVEYDGHLQPSGAPYTTKTDERFTSAAFEAKYRFSSFQYVTPLLLVGMGHREWQRDILPKGNVPGLYEVYRWSYAELGVAAEMRANLHWTITMEGRLRRQINPTIVINFGPTYDDLTLDLGVKNNYRLACVLNYKHSKALSLSMEVYWLTWDIGRSNTKIVTGVGPFAGGQATEPESKTNISGISFSAKF